MLRRVELGGAVDDRLFFAQVREDPQIEIEALAGHWDGPVAVVSSAGCTALSLVAAGAPDVTGIDVNRTQNHLVEFKAAAVDRLDRRTALGLLGATLMSAEDRRYAYRGIRGVLSPAASRYWDGRPNAVARGVLQSGVTERLMRLIARVVHLIHRGRVPELLRLPTIDDQRRFYRDEWDTAAWRTLFRMLCNRLVLRRAYDERFFAHVEDPSYATHFQRVAEHTLTDLAVADNYFLHYLLTGSYPAASRPPYLAGTVAVDRLGLVDATFTDYLRTRPDRSMAGYALSNICEWLTPEQIDDLFAEIVRTARPGARLVFRNFVGWTEVPSRWRDPVREDRTHGEKLISGDRSLCQRRVAVCEVNA